MSDGAQFPGLPVGRAGLRRIAEHPGLGGGRAVFRRELLQFLERLAMVVAALVVLLVAGTAGYMATEGASIGFGFVWALDTVATVGSIPEPASTGGQVVKVALIVLGVGTLFYALVTVTEFFVSGHLSGLLGERSALKKIDTMSGHTLICGFGRVGRQAGRDLLAAGRQFVVIDKNPDTREYAEALDAPFIEGYPSDDETLRTAGIMRAAGVIACVDSDAENIFLTMTARELRSDISIVARAGLEHAEKKLLRAGADHIVSPYKSSGSEMARFTMQPQVSGVVEIAPEYRMEEIEVTDGCPAVGRSVGEVRGASLIVALRRRDGHVQPQPALQETIEDGDVLVAVGETEALRRLESQMAPAG